MCRMCSKIEYLMKEKAYEKAANYEPEGVK